MDKRMITKMIAKTIVTTVLSGAITKTLEANVPATQKFNLAGMSGTVGGWMIGEQLEPRINEIVDNFFDRREGVQED